jgi:hypothetical protein
LGHTQLHSNLAELRTVLGAVAWGLFGITWIRARHIAFPCAQLDSVAIQESGNTLPGKLAGGGAPLAFAVLLVLGLFVWLGIPPRDGRGVLITATSIGSAFWFLTAAGALAENLECGQQRQSPRRRHTRALIVTIALVAAGIIMAMLDKP